MLFFGSIYGVLIIWADNAISITSAIPAIEESWQGDLLTVTEEWTIIIEHNIHRLSCTHSNFSLFNIPDRLLLGFNGREMRIDDLNLENYLRIACENFSFSTLTDVKEFIRFERVSDEVNYSTEQTSYFIDKVSIDEVKYEYFSGDEPLKNIKPRVLKNSSKAFCARAICNVRI
jgi:hypothetical protein